MSPMNVKRDHSPFEFTFEPVPPEQSPSWSDLGGASLRQFNTLGSTWAYLNRMESKGILSPQSEPDESEYDQFANIKGTVFETNPYALIGVKTPLERARRERLLKLEENDLDLISRGGIRGFLTSVAAGVFDPVWMLPVGGAAAKVSAGLKAMRAAKAGTSAAKLGALRGGAVVGFTGLVGTTAQEAVFQATQESQTLGESAINITADTLMSGILGSAVGYLSAKQRTSFSRAIGKDHDDPPIAGGSGMGPEDMLEPDDLATIVDAEGNITSPAEPKLKSAYGVEKLVTAIPSRLGHWGSIPFLRMMVKGSPGGKRVYLQMLDSSAKVVENLNLGRSAESDIHLLGEVQFDAIQTFRDVQFVNYRLRIAGKAPVEEMGPMKARRKRAQIWMGDRFNKKSKTTYDEKGFDEAVDTALRSGDRNATPEVEAVAKETRERLLGPMLQKMKKLAAEGKLGDMTLEHVKKIEELGPAGAMSYFIRRYNVAKIIAESDDFKNLTIKPWLRSELLLAESAAERKAFERLTREELATVRGDPVAKGELRKARFEENLDKAADEIYATITGTNTDVVHYQPIGGGNASPLKARVLNIGDALLIQHGWLDQNVMKSLERYTRTVVPDLILAERNMMGAQWEEQLRGIGKWWDEQINKVPQGTKDRLGKDVRRKLTQERQKEIRLLRDMHSLMRNRFATNDNTNQLVGKATAILRALTFLAFMGGAMLASIPEVGMVVMRMGLWRTFRTGLAPLITNTKGVKLALNESKLAGAAMDLTMNTRMRAMYEIGDQYATGTITKATQGAANMFGLANLLSPWNAAVKQFTGLIQQTKMLEVLENLAMGKAVKQADLSELAQLRIEGPVLERLVDQIRRHGVTTDGPIKFVDTRKWTNLEARLDFRAALKNAIDNTILTPGIGDKPLFMSTELGKTIFQFQSFAMAATTRLTLAAIQDMHQLKTWNGLALMVGMGIMVEAMKNQAAGKQALPDDPWDVIKAGADRSGALGYFGEVYNKGASLLGTSRLSSRYAARNAMSSMAGPVFGLGQTTFQLSRAIARGEITQADVNAGRRMLPGNQLFYFRKQVDQMEDAINEYFGVPRTRRRTQ